VVAARMTRVQSWGPGSRPSGIKVSQRRSVPAAHQFLFSLSPPIRLLLLIPRRVSPVLRNRRHQSTRIPLHNLSIASSTPSPRCCSTSARSDIPTRARGASFPPPRSPPLPPSLTLQFLLRSRLLAICSLCGAVCLTAMIVSGMAEDVMSSARRMRMRVRHPSPWSPLP
jgi:hypothetical protein